MIYYLLPQTSPYTYKYLVYENSGQPPECYICQSLLHYLTNIKEKITCREKEWDNYKKYTNTYEYIHTAVPTVKKPVSKYKPLSRSYFKMIELIYQFELIPTQRNKKPIKTFHLAEGPGGFIEAVANMRKNTSPGFLGIKSANRFKGFETSDSCDTYYGMTLDYDEKTNVHGWKKSEYFLEANPSVVIEKGSDQTGNILNFCNLEYCHQKYTGTMDFITADGGFDFSSNFNGQELSVANLLFAQVAYAVLMQKYGGSFVLKIFDSFHKHTIDIIYLLSSFYKQVYVCKPQTSRSGNSEKYIVCKGFLYQTTISFYGYIHNIFTKMEKYKTQEIGKDYYIHQFLGFPIPKFYLNRLEEHISVFGQQQLENIHFTMNLITKVKMQDKEKNDKIEQLIKFNVSKCIQWCNIHNIPHNPM